MKLFLSLLFGCGLLCAQPPRVGMLEFYGLHKVSAERVRKTLGVKEGGPLPASKGAVEERLEEISGVVRARLEAVCCEGDGAILFVGIEEKGAPHFAHRSPPAGRDVLSEEIVGTYRKFTEALETAAREGRTAEDLRSGHSLMADPDARLLQGRFAVFAETQLPLLRSVLRNSADEEHRAMAAYIIGYAPKKREVADDLQYALQDPEDVVRSNALRALGAIALLAMRDPDLGIRISPTWFVEMLHSVSLSDRNKAVLALLNLTDDRSEKVLGLIRERALDALVEMARWRSLRHAVGPYTLVGRLAGLTDARIQETWEKGEREAVIGKVLLALRK